MRNRITVRSMLFAATAALLFPLVPQQTPAQSTTVDPEFAVVIDELISNRSRYRRLTPDEAMNQLQRGNERFVNEQTIRRPLTRPEREALAAEQHPFAAILGCADSRVPVEVLFDRLPGDIFTVRLAGNIASDEAIGSLEYAVAKLNTPLIVVLGHQQCGAVAASMLSREDQATLPGKIPSLTEGINPSLTELPTEGDLPELFRRAKVLNSRYQVEKLLESNIISSAVAEGRLKVVAAHFVMDTGEVVFFDETTTIEEDIKRINPEIARSN